MRSLHHSLTMQYVHRSYKISPNPSRHHRREQELHGRRSAAEGVGCESGSTKSFEKHRVDGEVYQRKARALE